MAQEIVITSVRRGLDGGSGYQPVLRTQGMKPAVAERLQIRSGYSHPYPFGDPRNPVVFIHRIERVAGQTLNVLGRICDAGSDHTGRSNFLAHLAALDDTEARRKTAGPADVARRFAFKTTWNEQPREADPPTVIGADRSPAPCAAWRAAGLDPGLAGDLAEAAANGKETRLIVRQGDDVLALFADAIALLPAAKRWQVTFNTCEIEPFDATWRAVREDLPQARSWRGSPGVIDLTSSATKGSDSGYARFARGDVSALPWQTPVSDSAKPSTAVATSSPQSPPTDESSQQGPGPVVHHASETQAPRVASASPGDTTPPPPDGPSPPAGPKKRNYLEQVERAALDRDQREHAAPTQSKVLLLAGLTAVVMLLLTLVGGFAVVQMNPELVRRLATYFRDADESEGKAVVLAGQDEADNESTSLGENRQIERTRLKEEADRKKQRQAEADAEAAAADLAKKAADAAQMAAKHKERQEKEQAKRQKDQQKLAERQLAAYAALSNLEATTREDLPVAGDLDDRLKQATICSLDAEGLIDLSLDLATPAAEDPLPEREAFDAAIEPDRAQPLTWNLSCTPSREFDKNPPPIPLATITVKDGQLVLTAASKNILANQRFSHLRRSVLLVKSRNPTKPNEPIGVVKAIQLVRPTVVSPFAVSLLNGSKTFALPVPRGITVTDEHSKKIAFPKSSTVTYEVVCNYDIDGKETPSANTFSWQQVLKTKEKEWQLPPPAFHPMLKCPNANDTYIGLVVSFSGDLLNQKILPDMRGVGTCPYTFEDIKENVSLTEQELSNRIQRRCSALRQDLNTALVSLNEAAKGKKPYALLRKHGQAIESFLATRQQAPSTGGLVEAWLRQCESIVIQAKQAPTVGDRKNTSTTEQYSPEDIKRIISPMLDQWERTYLGTLNDWITYRAEQIKNEESEKWQQLRHFTLLLKPAQITVLSIKSIAFDKDNKEYLVTLLMGNPNDKPNEANPAQPIAVEGKPELQ